MALRGACFDPFRLLLDRVLILVLVLVLIVVRCVGYPFECDDAARQIAPLNNLLALKTV